MSECSHDCSGCDENCSERQPKSLTPHAGSSIKKVIGVVSGKGGVGKSMVTSQMAVLLRRRGYQTAILDADVTGPSIPRAFGITEPAQCGQDILYPSETKTGIRIMSMNLLLERDTDPVIWRGPVISGAVTQFWTDVFWGNVDYMFVDMPPGTGDVPLTVFQSLPIDGILVVASPQELVSMVVEKAVNMARMMDVPVLGLIENMSYLVCPDCGKEIHIFGPGRTQEAAQAYDVPFLGRMPIDPVLAALCDKGEIEDFSGDWLKEAADAVEKA